ncbi:hypothetical protein BaRGS_00017484, partial [Batillaria attramentaria]
HAGAVHVFVNGRDVGHTPTHSVGKASSRDLSVSCVLQASAFVSRTSAAQYGFAHVGKVNTSSAAATTVTSLSSSLASHPPSIPTPPPPLPPSCPVLYRHGAKSLKPKDIGSWRSIAGRSQPIRPLLGKSVARQPEPYFNRLKPVLRCRSRFVHRQ